MFVAFGGLALVVAAIGLYGSIGYGVAQRMHVGSYRGERGEGGVHPRVDQGLEWAASRARSLIHDNDVEKLKQTRRYSS